MNTAKQILLIVIHYVYCNGNPFFLLSPDQLDDFIGQNLQGY